MLQWHLVYLQCCAITTGNYRIIYHLERKSHTHWVVIPCSPLSSAPVDDYYSLCLWICLFWIFPRNGFICCMFFFFKSGLFHLVSCFQVPVCGLCISTAFFLWLDNISLYKSIHFLVPSSVNSYKLFLLFGYYKPLVLSLSGYRSRSRIVGSYGSSVFSFLKKHQTLSHRWLSQLTFQ